MAQTLFGSNATPSLPLLDANFTELYNSINGTGQLGIKVTGSISSAGSVATVYSYRGNNNIGWVDPTRAANNKVADLSWFGGVFYGRFVDDAYSAPINWLAVTGGSSSGVASIAFTATNLSLGGAGWTGGVEKMAVTQNVSLGRTISAYNSHNSAGSALLARVDFTATRLAEFYFGVSTSVGTITTNGTTTAYNTSSDARLKTNVVDAADAGALIDRIRVVSFNWKSNGDFSRYGFIAQELHQVAPEAVTVGDSGGDIEVTWGVDASKLVPLLVKELQTMRARVAALESA